MAFFKRKKKEDVFASNSDMFKEEESFSRETFNPRPIEPLTHFDDNQDMQLILTKIDNLSMRMEQINKKLEDIDKRLIEIEKIAKESQEPTKKWQF